MSVLIVNHRINGGNEMKKILLVILMSLLSVSGVSIWAQSQKKYDSIWEGSLDFGMQKLKVIVKIVLNEDGTRTAFLDSPDQGAVDIPATKVSVTKDSLKFNIANLGASFAGKFEHDGSTINGKFKQGPADVDLLLKKLDKLALPNRPQMPKKPYPYNEEELTFPNKEANITLAGTLTLPKGAGKFPAVVLVTGSGPQDRDEALFGHKPFLVIADYLTRNGIAVLRYDDRGIGKSTGKFSSALTTDFATDALSAIEYLKTRKEIDQNKIGIVGHSEGGIVAPMAASNSDEVKFIVMLAGPGMIGKDLIPLQMKLLSKAAGASDQEAEAQMKLSQETFDIIVSEPDSLGAYNKLLVKFQERISKLSAEEKSKPEYSMDAFNGLTKQSLSPWFRFFLKYDPRPALENVKVPVLAMNGEKDLQVPAKENLAIVESALKAGGNTKYKIALLPGLNHLFQTAITGGGNEYGKIEETISPGALKTMSDWILEVTGKM
jgi:uncharacterized protein